MENSQSVKIGPDDLHEDIKEIPAGIQAKIQPCKTSLAVSRRDWWFVTSYHTHFYSACGLIGSRLVPACGFKSLPPALKAFQQ